VVGAIILLPIYVFFRNMGPEFIRQLGPDYDIFPPVEYGPFVDEVHEGPLGEG
jgi:hypothetical protein